MNNCLGIINLDENESRIRELAGNRTLASVPVSARYRVIDFVLSNMSNSGVEAIGIFVKNKSRSLVSHLSNGRPWDLHRKKDGLSIFNFGEYDPVYDDVHNFIDNMEFIKQSRKKYVLISPSYMICNIDYNKAIEYHKKSKNDITVLYKNIDNADKSFINCEVLNLNARNRVISIGENIGTEKDANINMEMYIMKTELLVDMINECIKKGTNRKIKDFIKSNLDEFRVGAYEFKGYLSCINSVKSYYDTNMDLLKEEISRELFYDNMPIYTKSQDEAPTHYTDTSSVSNSIIASGSYIEGTVKNCVIGRRVNIGADSFIENCVIMQNSIIGSSVFMDKVITDKGTTVESEEVIKGIEKYPVVIQKEILV